MTTRLKNGLPPRGAHAARQASNAVRKSRHPRSIAHALATAVLAATALCSLPAAQAITIAKTEVPEQQSVDGRTLVLNGAGLRQRFVFQVYVAALYRPQPSHDARAILDSQEPQLLRLTLLRDINSKALTDALNEGLKANNAETDLAAMGGTIKAFETFMATGGEGASGDRVDIVFNRGKVSVSFKGKALGEVDDPRFSTALLKVWLGSAPAQESLKSALLGQKTTTH